MVSVILDNLAEGETYEWIMEGYRVTREDIRASLMFAADPAADRPIPPEPGVAGWSSSSTKIGSPTSATSSAFAVMTSRRYPIRTGPPGARRRGDRRGLSG